MRGIGRGGGCEIAGALSRASLWAMASLVTGLARTMVLCFDFPVCTPAAAIFSRAVSSVAAAAVTYALRTGRHFGAAAAILTDSLLLAKLGFACVEQFGSALGRRFHRLSADQAA